MFPQAAIAAPQRPRTALLSHAYDFAQQYSADNVLYRPVFPPVTEVLTVQKRKEPQARSSGPGTSTRANRTITEEALRQYLEGKKSPLAEFSAEVLASPHWSTIIGICTIEQYGCSRLPGGTNWNLWGIGGASGLRRYSTAREAIDAVSSLLARYESRGYDTIEELNGYYVQPASQNWLKTVLTTKEKLESL